MLSAKRDCAKTVDRQMIAVIVENMSNPIDWSKHDEHSERFAFSAPSSPIG
jgi:hypothetical protein